MRASHTKPQKATTCCKSDKKPAPRLAFKQGFKSGATFLCQCRRDFRAKKKLHYLQYLQAKRQKRVASLHFLYIFVFLRLNSRNIFESVNGIK